MSENIITRRIQLKVDKETNELLTLYNKYVWLMSNKIITSLIFNSECENRFNLNNDHTGKIKNLLKNKKEELENAKKLDKDFDSEEINNKYKIEIDAIKTERKHLWETILGTSEQNSTYQIVSNEYKGKLPSGIFNSVNSTITKTFLEIKKDILEGKKSAPTYRNNIPIPFTTQKMLFSKIENKIILNWFNDVKFILEFGKDKSNNKIIVEKIIKGEYKFCDSSIQNINGKWFLNLTTKIPTIKHKLNNDLILGLDLGINTPLFGTTPNDITIPELRIGDKDSFFNQRKQFEKKRRELQKSMVIATGGHGRKKKTKHIDYLRKKERNWVHTINHTYSKEVINHCIKHQIGTIHMEDLSNFRNNPKHKYILGKWSYYELQNMITYKSKINNINVKYVNPKYTSQTCSYCNNKDKEQRNGETFSCSCCEEGRNINSDFNASRNIAKSEFFIKK